MDPAQGAAGFCFNDPALLASAWIGQNEILLVIANLGETPVNAVAQVRPALLQGKLARAIDAVSGESIEFDGRSLRTAAANRSFRLLELKARISD